MNIVKAVLIRIVPIAMGVVAYAPDAAYGQQTVITISAPEPADALSMLASGTSADMRQAATVIRAAFRKDRADGEVIRVGNYEKYSAHQRQQLLDGLERIAIGTGVPHTSTAPDRALAILNTIAFDPAVDVAEESEIPGRLLRIYSRTTSRAVRSLAVLMLGDVASLTPPETPQILELLEEIATTAPLTMNAIGHQVWAPEQVRAQTAIDALVNAGPQGISVLRRLHEDRSVNDAAARAALDAYAARGFPLERRGPIRPPGR